MNEILTSNNAPFKNGPGNNDNEEVLHTPQISGTGASPLDVV